MTHLGSKHDAEETLAHHVEQSQVLGPDFPLVGRLGRRIEQGQGHRRTIVGQLHSFACRRRVASLLAANVDDGENDDENDDENGDTNGDDDHQRKVVTCYVVRSSKIV